MICSFPKFFSTEYVLHLIRGIGVHFLSIMFFSRLFLPGQGLHSSHLYASASLAPLLCRPPGWNLLKVHFFVNADGCIQNLNHVYSISADPFSLHHYHHVAPCRGRKRPICRVDVGRRGTLWRSPRLFVGQPLYSAQGIS